MLRTQIYLSEDQLKLLKECAYKENVSVSLIIRKIIADSFCMSKPAKNKKINSGSWLLGLAKKAKKLKLKGPKDLAGNLDKYLYGEK